MHGNALHDCHREDPPLNLLFISPEALFVHCASSLGCFQRRCRAEPSPQGRKGITASLCQCLCADVTDGVVQWNTPACWPMYVCLISAGSVGLELAAGRDGKAVGSENGHYKVGEARVITLCDLKVSRQAGCWLLALSSINSAAFCHAADL